MTMAKREMDSIWSTGRSDVETDALNVNNEAYHTSDDETHSDRSEPAWSSGRLTEG